MVLVGLDHVFPVDSPCEVFFSAGANSGHTQIAVRRLRLLDVMTAPYSGPFASGTVGPIGSTGTFFQNANLFDPGSSSAPAWTPGAYQIIPVPQQPSLTEEWAIQAWTVSLNLLQMPVANGTTQFGRFGKLIGALIPNAAGITHSSAGMPWLQPITNVPSSALQDTIWDETPGRPPADVPNSPRRRGRNLPRRAAGAYVHVPEPFDRSSPARMSRWGCSLPQGCCSTRTYW